ncbi:MAG TPA: ATP-binding protein [Candidatus Hydrogenedentes bacterium]|jgi:signal transduction histidine kinase|nr:PAS domain-containing sensor histidine kinase [Candidatus Hydrogenedentota bacterium]OQB43552.1 MAG: Sporulation kinase A [Candidatus Hydrogenedentes bacterium ADurb.Bin179]HOC68244.1 ATP-binding protein [Candidatus Hydrogenedentota bacterium]
MTTAEQHNPTLTALQERIKELTCLLRMADIAGEPGISVEEILQQTVMSLAPAWQYPQITRARIVLDGCVYALPEFKAGIASQRADIRVQKEIRGYIEVHYLEEKPDLDEGPFLLEERNLLNAVARQVGAIVERKQAEQERIQLQEQLRHADRLATLGLLAAGVAHELNEPLGNILGFSELARKSPGVPVPVTRDLTKIETAALHAREIIKKLLVFARQDPPHKEVLNLNEVVRDGLFFLEARCAKSGITVVYALEPELPLIDADAGQLRQVVVNLVVNALQAMPEGGRLSIQTGSKENSVSLIVEDTGVGMSPEVQQRVFVPFFTTKEVGEGTGLGLPVVHGIVLSHDGTVQMDSVPGRGTRIEVLLPIVPQHRLPEGSPDDQ